MGSLPVLDQAPGSGPPSPPHLSAAGSSCARSGHQRLSARTRVLQRRASEGRAESARVSAGPELQGPGGDAGPAGGPSVRAAPADPPGGWWTDRGRLALSIFSPPPRYRVGFCGGSGGTEPRRAGGQWVSYTGKKLETRMGKERQSGFQRSSSRSSERWSCIRRLSERKDAESERRRRGMDRCVRLP